MVNRLLKYRLKAQWVPDFTENLPDFVILRAAGIVSITLQMKIMKF